MNERAQIEKIWDYLGFKCVVMFQPLCHRTGYVAIPKGHACFGLSENNSYEMALDCHGGITYAADSLVGMEDVTDVWWIGFDTAHYGDYPDYAKGLEIFHENQEMIEHICNIMTFMHQGIDDKIRSLEYCMCECEYMVEQLIAAARE